MAEFHLVLIETGANQDYIFGSNRLREVVGATELLHRIGTSWVVDAVDGGAAKKIWPNDQSQKPELELKDYLFQQQRIEDACKTNPDAVEIVIATSGKALILACNEAAAKNIVSAVTRRALKEAPGLTVVGAIAPVNGDRAKALHTAIGAAHRRHEKLRSLLPGPEARLPRLPLLDECGSTGLPASDIDEHAQDFRFMDTVSDVTRAKRDRRVRENGWRRIRKSVEDHDPETAKLLLASPDKLDEMELKWSAVVHADGNGVGAILLNFPTFAQIKEDSAFREYVEKFRKFSLELESCTAAAVTDAIRTNWQELHTRSDRARAPIVPLVLGGDDLTVVCDGGSAVRFAAAFVEAFETRSAQFGQIAVIAQNAFGVRRLSASAGVAIVKPHFPFHRAYDLCEDLTRSAKKAKSIITIKGVPEQKARQTPFPCSTFDFHVLFDASGAELDGIRKRLELAEAEPGRLAYLFAGPYVATPRENLKAVEGSRWAEHRYWSDLKASVDALSRANGADLEQEAARDDGILPRGQQHALREALHAGPAIADARLSAIKHRYPSFAWGSVTFKSEASLFFEDDDENRHGEAFRIQRARLLDAMLLADVEAQRTDVRE